ncbi:PREDICTED: uncharacterized protein LOC102008193 isoform X2 [Chinchilla lanigera]|uniref:uncharacterized protein LOC102008193 isoform X2 n=1 Tax=Chinchilla lanigera TaxID=34839 RepID=UPI00038EFB88|nr:PREDICTED: uncharacterized protein LOC102008193 isoform X2 [Chinchilla lanigera]
MLGKWSTTELRPQSRVSFISNFRLRFSQCKGQCGWKASLPAFGEFASSCRAVPACSAGTHVRSQGGAVPLWTANTWGCLGRVTRGAAPHVTTLWAAEAPRGSWPCATQLRFLVSRSLRRPTRNLLERAGFGDPLRPRSSQILAGRSLHRAHPVSQEQRGRICRGRHERPCGTCHPSRGCLPGAFREQPAPRPCAAGLVVSAVCTCAEVDVLEDRSFCLSLPDVSSRNLLGSSAV